MIVTHSKDLGRGVGPVEVILLIHTHMQVAS